MKGLARYRQVELCELLNIHSLHNQLDWASKDFLDHRNNVTLGEVSVLKRVQVHTNLFINETGLNFAYLIAIAKKAF